MSFKVKEELVRVSAKMYGKGMVNAYEGNLSILVDDRVYITPSGKCKGFLTEDMIVVTDLEGNILDGMYKPSSEIKLHLAAYKYRENIGAVVHAHPPYATSFAIANKPIETKAYAEVIMFYGKIPVAKYGTPSSDEVFADVREYIKEYDIILLANHGVMSVGSNIYDAFFKMEAAESIAKTLLLAKLLGGAKNLPQDKLDELQDIRLRKQGK
ncbi:MAG: class II aldolase/adducin family protein [Clostridiaceae bacterium]|nr:class II aldolase/adducin family protein [Clostridiaceae bacterium]